jgi:hypothetical protein
LYYKSAEQKRVREVRKWPKEWRKCLVITESTEITEKIKGKLRGEVVQ